MGVMRRMVIVMSERQILGMVVMMVVNVLFSKMGFVLQERSLGSVGGAHRSII